MSRSDDRVHGIGPGINCDCAARRGRGDSIRRRHARNSLPHWKRGVLSPFSRGFGAGRDVCDATENLVVFQRQARFLDSARRRLVAAWIADAAEFQTVWRWVRSRSRDTRWPLLNSPPAGWW